MALTLPIASSSSPSPGNSPVSVDGSVPPQTPITPTAGQTLSLPLASSPEQNNNIQSQSSSTAPINGAVTQVKRKPSRRANTAERRATHNAVERQRRETLNGRFLDLAGLLPNLSQIRRPSKSAIVNSSIAHVHASRRHRFLASRELRALKQESDALRRELNEWRDRAGLPCVEEPVRGEGFSMVLNGEVEILAAVIGEEDEEGQGYDGYDEGDDEFAGSMPNAMDDSEDIMPSAPIVKNGMYAHGSAPPTDVNIAHLMSRAPPNSHGAPMIAQMHSSVSFENPEMPSVYEPRVNFAAAPYIGHHPAMEQHNMKTWSNMYNAYHPQHPHQLPVQRNLITPPNGSHMGPSATTGNHFGDQAALANLKRQQLLALQQHGAMGYIADVDDTSSVGSGHSSPGSGYGSPSHGASSMSYEIANALPDYGLPKRLSLGNLHINTGIAGSWSGGRVEDGMGGMMTKQGLSVPINVGNGGGYGMMI
ncbi:uncharacterized protein BJ212DRAFT_1443573 [Suillus subaureus]|uniref:BHLH domain-containing protein n=1 Tax=Suillus subaureus TaxID=48587 RepID=A0A9P7ER31_9AGAM|nr:uncharacterized protein BJ212DRAFT_1443573 [Suillus subaureus]KAG1827633.1 hypothetical protein BJ212DRAFT_1443573 [Suillus subaureus]